MKIRFYLRLVIIGLFLGSMFLENAKLKEGLLFNAAYNKDYLDQSEAIKQEEIPYINVKYDGLLNEEKRYTNLVISDAFILKQILLFQFCLLGVLIIEEIIFYWILRRRGSN
jgi:hypothetical protein